MIWRTFIPYKELHSLKEPIDILRRLDFPVPMKNIKLHLQENFGNFGVDLIIEGRAYTPNEWMGGI